MSQPGDTGLFSVRRPRETLGGINHNASAIPMPSSAMKRTSSIGNFQQPPFTVQHARSTSGSRMSLAPGRPQQPLFQRSSSGTNLVDLNGPMTINRPPSANMFSSTGGRKSYAPFSNTPANPLNLQNSTQRRSSVYSARHSSNGPLSHQSFFTTAPIPAGVPRDPRPLKDRSYQAQLGAELMEYLTQHNFEMVMKHSLTQNTMKSPTQKDFNYMFQFLYHQLDPAYHFQKNIDAEVPPILKLLRYPFEKSITKSQIAAVGGQNWSTFLGMLHWMMQLAKMAGSYSTGGYDDASAEAGFDVSGDRIIFDFLTDAYREWLSVEDDADDDDAEKLIKPHIEAMARKFEEGNRRWLDQEQILEAELQNLNSKIEDLGRSGPRLEKLSEQIRILEEDRGKFEQYNESMEAKVEKYSNRIKLLEEEIARTERELEEAEQEKRELQDTVDAQGITIADIDRMNSERERLLRGVESTVVRLDESKRRTSEKEREAAARLDELERAVENYNHLGYEIGIIPSTATNAKGVEYELVLAVFNSGAADGGLQSSHVGPQDESQRDRLLLESNQGYQPHHLLNLDLRGTTKNSLNALRREIHERRNTALESDLHNQDLLDKIREAIDDKQAEVEALGHRVRAAEEEFEKTKEICSAQKMGSDAQIEKMEKELARLRAGLVESVQSLEQREMSTNIEYQSLTHSASALREQLHGEIERMLNEVIKFKVHIQKSLEDYEAFVAEEVERELTAQEDGADEEERRNEDGEAERE